MTVRRFIWAMGAVVMLATLARAGLSVRDVGPAADPATIEVRGVAAGAFDPAIWLSAKLHFVRDVRSPLLEPREGKFRNIYAPSGVQTQSGWAIFYGGWDGTPSGNDRIYRADTADFLTFSNRHNVIEHGDFEHVCNVNVSRDETGGWAMMCTAYPDANGRNKPITFFSRDGERWSGSDSPHRAVRDEIISIDGYERYADADINGMNVLLRDGGKWRIYFGDFRNFGKTFRASSDDGRRFVLGGKAIDGNFAINDVKKFRVGDESWYLAGLHMNTDRLFYSLARGDGTSFPPPRTLLEHADDADRYMVAVGLVVAGEQEQPGRRVLGVLYGAGAAPTLDQNRIFAVWLQKRIIVEAEGERVEFDRSLGPDRQVLRRARPLVGTIKYTSEDGETLIGSAPAVTMTPGRAYALHPSER